MKLGIAPSGRRSAADAVRLARLAEDAGLSEVWVSEDYLERGSFAVAGGMAAVTERVAIGLGVINPWTRHVGLAAMEAAALDEVSGGRAIIGLGASNERWMQGTLGIPFTTPIARLAEYSDALRDLLAGRSVERPVGGQDVNARLGFEPLRPDIPIVWGVKGPRALELGVKHADGLMLSVLSSAGYVRWIRENFSTPSVTAYASFASDSDGAAARDRLRAHTAQFLGIHGSSPITREAGIAPELAQQFRDRMIAGRGAAELVTEEILDAVTVSGTPEPCGNRLLELRDAGVDTLVVIDDGSGEPDQLVAGLMAAARSAGLS